MNTKLHRSKIRLRVVVLFLGLAGGLSDRIAASTEGLAGGWWRGAVTLENGPMEFYLEVAQVGPLEPLIKVHTEAAVTELVKALGPDAFITLSSTQPGERLEGQLRSGTFVGRYFPSEGGPAGGFSFRASPAESWEPTPPLKVWNLTGAWVLQTGPTEEIDVVLAHREHSLRAIWKERDGTVRYLAGRIEGQRFALEVWQENRIVFGRYTPDGVLHGEWTEPDGRATSFQMRRKAPLARPSAPSR